VQFEKSPSTLRHVLGRAPLGEGFVCFADFGACARTRRQRKRLGELTAQHREAAEKHARDVEHLEVSPGGIAAAAERVPRSLNLFIVFRIERTEEVKNRIAAKSERRCAVLGRLVRCDAKLGVWATSTVGFRGKGAREDGEWAGRRGQLASAVPSGTMTHLGAWGPRSPLSPLLSPLFARLQAVRAREADVSGRLNELRARLEEGRASAAAARARGALLEALLMTKVGNAYDKSNRRCWRTPGERCKPNEARRRGGVGRMASHRSGGALLATRHLHVQRSEEWKAG